MKKEQQRQKKLEAAALRMGLDTDQDLHLDEDDFQDGEAFAKSAQEKVRQATANFSDEVGANSAIKEPMMDQDLQDDLDFVEQELANLVTTTPREEKPGAVVIGDDIEND